MLLPPDLPEAERRQAIDATLVKREGRPENIAQAVLFFVDNDFVTGVCLPVEAGERCSLRILCKSLSRKVVAARFQRAGKGAWARWKRAPTTFWDRLQEKKPAVIYAELILIIGLGYILCGLAVGVPLFSAVWIEWMKRREEPPLGSAC